MKRFAIIELRPGIATDFSNEDKTKKIGQLYFRQSSTGKIEPTIQVFSEDTNMLEFKQLYAANQIYVFANTNDITSTFNCIDWNQIDKELDHELEQLDKLKKTA